MNGRRMELCAQRNVASPRDSFFGRAGFLTQALRFKLEFFECQRSVRIFGLRVVIYFNDHRPAHAHVIGKDCEAVFAMDCERNTVLLTENYGFRRKEIARMTPMLMAALPALCAAWKEIHGDF
jgi:hypothetical protein